MGSGPPSRRAKYQSAPVSRSRACGQASGPARGVPTSGSPGERLDQPTYVTRKRLNVAGPTGFLVRCDGSLPGLNRLGPALVHQLGGGLRRNDERIRLRKLEQL